MIELGNLIELGSTRHYGPVQWRKVGSLREALELTEELIARNIAYPYQIRVDGVIRWERLPENDFRWVKVLK